MLVVWFCSQGAASNEFKEKPMPRHVTLPIRQISVSIFSLVLLVCLFIPLTVLGQAGNGVIQGTVKDPAGAVLHGAKIAVQPSLQPVTTDGQGQFLLLNVPAGTYQVTISYVGFAPYTTTVTVYGGKTASIDASLKVASAADQVVVTAPRLFGDDEAINRVLAADNIIQVLPAEVITSLPNANIADALGRMPSVSVERDEGEAKYVQIRGTEPRLSNVTVDGVSIPSPESGVRQIKLDTIASDLVSSIEVNKTLEPNMDADGIGGSVNLVTKTAQEQPTVSIFGIGGYTPIDNGRSSEQLASTIGKRFGPSKKYGILLAGSYDYNGRGINDTEPVPTPGDAVPHYDSQDLRNYAYDRTRWGFAGSMDYRLSGGSSISARGLFSNFRNWGDDYIHTLNDGAFPTASHSRRRPNMAISSFALEGHHLFKSSELLWTGAVSRSRSAGGYGGANYSWVGDQNLDCHNDQSLATSVYRPGWAGCFGNGLDNVSDPNNYVSTVLDIPTLGKGAELTLTGSTDYSRQLHFGSHFDSVAFGFKIRNNHKYDNTYNTWWTTPTYSASNAEPMVNGQTLMLNDGDNIPIAVSAH